MKPDRNFCQILAKEMRKARISARKTQFEVLCDTNLHIGRIEQGESSIELFTFIILCSYYNIHCTLILDILVSEGEQYVKQRLESIQK